jgi:ribose 5-phosphate isomerase B
MIGNDHGGYRLKLTVVKYLLSRGVEVENIGADSEEIVRYPYYAAQVARAVGTGLVDRGILICSTGIGMSIAANRHRGVRASLCTSTYMGKMTRAHNDSNILCLGGKITGEFEALDIVQAWLDTSYEGGRHDISLCLINEMDEVVTIDREWQPAGERI